MEPCARWWIGAMLCPRRGTSWPGFKWRGSASRLLVDHRQSRELRYPLLHPLDQRSSRSTILKIDCLTDMQFHSPMPGLRIAKSNWHDRHSRSQALLGSDRDGDKPRLEWKHLLWSRLRRVVTVDVGIAFGKDDE